jgi:hypothetical protein
LDTQSDIGFDDDLANPKQESVNYRELDRYRSCRHENRAVFLFVVAAPMRLINEEIE